MNILMRWLCITLILFITGVFSVAAEEFDSANFQNTTEKIEVLDFKETPISDVLKVFTDLTGKNVVASKEVTKLKVTLFLKEVSPEEALKTMCKLYNLWFTEEDSVIRIMTAEEYAEELTIRRDEKTVVHKLKYASCLAVADLLNNLFGNRIEYIEPAEIESYGHVGTEEGMNRGATRRRREDRYRRGYRARTTRETLIAGRRERSLLEVEKELPSRVIEELEKKAEEKRVELKDILEARRQQAIIYLAVFPRNNSIVCRSVDLRILSDISDFIKKVDTPTSQVLLEGKILEFTLTDDFKSFFDFDISPDLEQGEHIIDIGEFTPLESSTLIYRFIDEQIKARVELFEENNRVKIIGTPMILCANNAPGEFFIGEERPITVNYEHEIREFEERTTETVRPVIGLRDIGTKLTITPSVNEDRTVTMRFLAEVDSVKPGGASISLVNEAGKVIVLPIDTVDTSRVENIIIAKDTTTLAIGGLIRETDQDYERKVPVLGDIPLLGFFFKKKGVEKERTETVFLITPHIMMAPEEGQRVSDETIHKLSDHPYIKEKQGKLLKNDNFNPDSFLKGEVLIVDKEYKFAIINLGEGDGLRLGDTLLVYHKDKFIGDVKVVEFRYGLSIVDTTKAIHLRRGDKIMRGGDKITGKRN